MTDGTDPTKTGLAENGTTGTGFDAEESLRQSKNGSAAPSAPLGPDRRNWLARAYPFNGEQTLNIASEIGPLFVMFLVNFLLGVEAGVWALIASTMAALIASLIVLKRPPFMPFIAGAVTVVFGALTLYTHDANWIQIKVTIFNGVVALLLFGGLWKEKYFFEFVFGKTFQYTTRGWAKLTRNAAFFFLLTAVANEMVRLGFATANIPCPHSWLWLMRKPFLSGLEIWMIFKLFIVVPLTGVFFVWQVHAMQRYRLPAPSQPMSQRSLKS